MPTCPLRINLKPTDAGMRKPALLHGMSDPVIISLHAANGWLRWVLAPNACHYRCRQSDDRCTHPAVHSTRGISDHRCGMLSPVEVCAGQPNHAFIREEWIHNMREMNGSFVGTRYRISTAGDSL